jgi:hypothetical protein
VARMEQEALQRVSLFHPPATGDRRRRTGRIDQVHVCMLAECEDVVLCRPCAAFTLFLRVIECIAQGGSASKLNVRRVKRGLARVEVDVQELKMCAHRSSHCQCCFEDDEVGLATACRDKDFFHLATLPRWHRVVPAAGHRLDVNQRAHVPIAAVAFARVGWLCPPNRARTCPTTEASHWSPASRQALRVGGGRSGSRHIAMRDCIHATRAIGREICLRSKSGGGTTQTSKSNCRKFRDQEGDGSNGVSERAAAFNDGSSRFGRHLGGLSDFDAALGLDCFRLFRAGDLQDALVELGIDLGFVDAVGKAQ